MTHTASRLKSTTQVETTEPASATMARVSCLIPHPSGNGKGQVITSVPSFLRDIAALPPGADGWTSATGEGERA